jgi:ferric-dicitrate binding protein FerR (iron transport regulator)
MKIPENIVVLIEKYQLGTITQEEEKRLNEWYNSFHEDEADLSSTEYESEQQLAARMKGRILETIRREEPLFAVVHKRRWKMVAAAAVLLILFSAGAYRIFLYNSDKTEATQTIAANNQDTDEILPGGNKATLSLADGSTIILDSVVDGTIGHQGNIKIEKLSNGQLAYSINGKRITENDEAFYNTISTPRGGQYKVTLADGSEVWLNAASSIRFPVAFTGIERKVEITGEAYFEVAPDKTRPFKVVTMHSEVEVLGTHFNVNAYNDEASNKTTLLEGKVKVSILASSQKQSTQYLIPGQQANINKDGKIKLVQNADIEEAVAWKNGRFQFNSADLKSILRQLSRWYDVEIDYKGDVDLHFTGQITRNENILNVLEKLKLTGAVNFTIEGRKIIVSP